MESTGTLALWAMGGCVLHIYEYVGRNEEQHLSSGEIKQFVYIRSCIKENAPRKVKTISNLRWSIY